MYSLNDFMERLYGEYVPPCQRNPYYDDPRDVKPNVEQTIRDTVYNMSGVNQTRNTPIDLHSCIKCGTLFQPGSSSDILCYNCRSSQ